MRFDTTAVAFTLLAALVVSGCPSKKYVNTEVEALQAATDVRMSEIEGQVEANQETLGEHQTEIAELSRTAQEALDRAIAAGKLAEGKFLYETVLSDDKIHFEFDKAHLSPDAGVVLDEFIADITARDENIFIEVQGHTDSIDTEAYNLELGERRADAVRRYLNGTGGLPLHRLSVISYGESAMLTAEASPEARAQNRRVTLVVLQ